MHNITILSIVCCILTVYILICPYYSKFAINMCTYTHTHTGIENWEELEHIICSFQLTGIIKHKQQIIKQKKEIKFIYYCTQNHESEDNLLEIPRIVAFISDFIWTFCFHVWSWERDCDRETSFSSTGQNDCNGRWPAGDKVEQHISAGTYGLCKLVHQWEYQNGKGSIATADY